jgi:hypothetical protein
MSFSRISEAVINSVNSVFGSAAEYTHEDTSVDSIVGVFDNAFIEINGVTTQKPILKINFSDLTSDPVPDVDSVVINSIQYLVIDCQLDGFGGATLILQRY